MNTTGAVWLLQERLVVFNQAAMLTKQDHFFRGICMKK